MPVYFVGWPFQIILIDAFPMPALDFLLSAQKCRHNHAKSNYLNRRLIRNAGFLHNSRSNDPIW